MANIRPKIIEVVDVDMVTRVFFNVTSCRVLSTGSLVVKYLEEGIENTKIYKKASWCSYSRVWENAYLGGYLASHPLKDDFMNEPIFEVTELDGSSDDEPIEFEPIGYKPAECCSNCKHWHITDLCNMYGLCSSRAVEETAAEDSCSDFEPRKEC